MSFYGPVMQWVGLFLFNKGLATFSGDHRNVSLLFPMEDVFEGVVTHSFRRYQEHYEVAAKHPQKHLATIDAKQVFTTKPDIALRDGMQVVYILDAKWKGIESGTGDPRQGVDQSDMYQVYAYGKRYGCAAVALVYPQSRRFSTELRYRFFDGLPVICLPFDVMNPKDSVQRSLRILQEEGHDAA